MEAASQSARGPAPVDDCWLRRLRTRLRTRLRVRLRVRLTGARPPRKKPLGDMEGGRPPGEILFPPRPPGEGLVRFWLRVRLGIG